MKKCLISLAAVFFLVCDVSAQISARMFRDPDVSNNQIAFVYAGDIWLVSKNGGTAIRISSPNGEEKFPKFSPDGSMIAFTANYEGNWDVYTIPTTGGVPNRLTSHGGADMVVDWNPAGDKVLFSSSRESGRQRFSQLFEVSIDGGLPTKLAPPYGSLASYSPEGTKLAFNFKSRIYRTWKRYKGGWAPDIWTYDLTTNTSKNITNNPSSDEFPMWSGNKIYYLSDDGPNTRYNIWVYDIETESNSQITNYTEYDIHYPSLGPGEIVYENEGKLYLMNLSNQESTEVKVSVITDQTTLATRRENARSGWFDVSPDGKRLIVSARGDVFSVPAEEGITRNLTRTSGAFDRKPSWSPDGKKVAFWTDETGEYQLKIHNIKNGTSQIVSNYSSGFRYALFWSPDSKKLAFVDQTMAFQYFDLDSKQTVQLGKGKYLFHGGLLNYTFSWSSDSKWIAYTVENGNRNTSIHLFNTDSKTSQKVTSGYYNDFSPTFDPDNKYLFFLTNRNISPEYSSLDNTFIYPNSTMIAAVPLTKATDSPLKPKNDEVELQSAESNDDVKKKDKKNDSDSEQSVKIDLAGFEERIVLLPVEPGNYGALEAVSGKVVFMQFPYTGSPENSSDVKYYDIEEREVKTIIGSINGGIEIAANGNKIAVSNRRKHAILDIAEGQKMDKIIDLSNLKVEVNPMAEWKQIFADSWRFQRDYFYDKDMHGLDWNAIKEQYGKLIEQCVTRWDVNYVLGEMISELNASHTYRGGGDLENTNNVNVGYLGVDWSKENGAYRIKRVVRGASWDAEVVSPLDAPGVNINVGDYVLAVNGVPIDPSDDPNTAFQGMAGETVELTVNSSPSMNGSRTELVKTLNSESRLRHLEWIENNRKLVDEKTNGRIGYIYVRSTGIDGQNELIRQFTAQYHKDGLIIDERFNSGGQIPDRFIEMLDRKPLAFWAVRDGDTWQWPPVANFGPKVMLINGWSGSGGDAFPDYFKKAGLGPLIGTRTWGGLIGISGAPTLIDGGGVTVPTFRMYNPDGTWFKEGYGVDPDIEVKENPGELAQGTDAQLLRAIEWINKELETYEGRPGRPEKEKR